ncbi:MAG: radical SAM protein [Candidatus Uhrbacteria bacterium]
MAKQRKRVRGHMRLPIDAVIAVTYICNSRCTMCDFWKETRQPTMTLNDYRKLPKTLRDINLSGGEPFLHKDIVEIVRVIREACPKAQITISTNGFLTDQIVERVQAIRCFYADIGIRISIDGVGAMHERIRRIPNAFDRCRTTLRALKETGVKNLGVAYTMSSENIDHATQVYEFAQTEGVQFTDAVVHNSEAFFGGKENLRIGSSSVVESELDIISDAEIRSWHPKRWARAYFTWGLKRFAVDGVQVCPSRAGEDFFFLDPFGNVMPSVMHPNSMGNLTEVSSFEELWQGERAQRARFAAVAFARPYWMVCTARTAMRRHALRVIAWILSHKIATLFTKRRR